MDESQAVTSFEINFELANRLALAKQTCKFRCKLPKKAISGSHCHTHFTRCKQQDASPVHASQALMQVLHTCKYCAHARLACMQVLHMQVLQACMSCMYMYACPASMEVLHACKSRSTFDRDLHALHWKFTSTCDSIWPGCLYPFHCSLELINYNNLS